MKLSPYITGLALAINAASAQVLLWDCSRLPDVCQNMCWGVNCAGQQQALSLLHWDRPSRAVQDRRRTASGCLPAPNRCSARGRTSHVDGYNCDEFPFASVQEADGGSQWTRCTPKSQNDLTRGSQGWVLSRFYRAAAGCNGQPCQFSIAFAQVPGGDHYCHATNANWAHECVNDQRGANNEQEHFNGNGLANNPGHWKRDANPAPHTVYTYRLKSGTQISTSAYLKNGAKTVSIGIKKAASSTQQGDWDSIYQGLANKTEDDVDANFWGATDDWDENVDEIAEQVSCTRFVAKR